MNRIRSRQIIHVRIKTQSTNSNKSARSKHEKPAGLSVKRISKNRKVRDDRFSDGTIDLNEPSHTCSMDLRNNPVNQNGLSDDYHRKKKENRQKSRSCLQIAVILIIAVVLIITLSVLLSLLLTKNTTRDRLRAPAILQWNRTGVTVAGNGSGGGVSNNLTGPHGFTWDSSGLLYIVEHWGHRITTWKPEAVNGTIIAGLTNQSCGTTSDAFCFPVDIFLEPDGSFYVTDAINERFQYWSKGSLSGSSVAGVGSNTSIGLRVPYNIARHPVSSSLFLNVIINASVVEYPSGAVVAGGNGIGNASNQLNAPEGLVYDQVTNDFIIANGGSHTLARWKYGANNGTVLFGTPGWMGNSSNTFSRPMGLAMDPMGNIYVADYGNHRVQLFINGESEGRTILGTNGVPGSTPTLLYNPISIKLDNQLNLFVSDHVNGRIQKFYRY